MEYRPNATPTYLAVFLKTLRLFTPTTHTVNRLRTPLSRLAAKLVSKRIPILGLSLSDSFVHHFFVLLVVETIRAVTVLAEFASGITDTV
jgi:hypothetical protein